MAHLAAVAAAAVCTLTWHGVPSPALWGTQLNAVSATAPDDAWAVGGPAPRGRSVRPVVEHWDGTRWRRAAIPAMGAELQDVAAIARDDVWAVGGDLLEHWNGSRWRRFSVPGVAGLTAVSASGRDDVWAVGAGALLHWDGARWTVRLRSAGVRDVTALAADDIWAVAASGRHFVELHWNGRRWLRYSERVAGDNLRAVAVSAGAPDDVWAAGDVDSDGPAWPNAVVVHWTGERWQRVQASPRIFVLVEGLLASGPDAPLLTGFRANGDAYGGGAREQLSGSRWRETDTRRRVVLGVGADRAGGVWGVGVAGSYPNGLGFPTVARPLVERGRCA